MNLTFLFFFRMRKIGATHTELLHLLSRIILYDLPNSLLKDSSNILLLGKDYDVYALLLPSSQNIPGQYEAPQRYQQINFQIVVIFLGFLYVCP